MNDLYVGSENINTKIR